MVVSGDGQWVEHLDSDGRPLGFPQAADALARQRVPWIGLLREGAIQQVGADKHLNAHGLAHVSWGDVGDGHGLVLQKILVGQGQAVAQINLGAPSRA